MPAAAAAAGYAQAGPYLYVAGGWNDQSPTTNVAVTQRLDLRTGSWSVGPAFSPATADFALAATDSAVYAIAGDRPGGGFFDDSKATYRLATSLWPAGTWTASDPLTLGMSANRGGFCTEGFLGQEVWTMGGVDSYGFSDGEAFFHRVRPERCATVRADVAWLSVDDSSLFVDADGRGTLALTVDARSLAPGVHEAAVFLTTTDPGAPEIRVPVTVTVVAPTRHR